MKSRKEEERKIEMGNIVKLFDDAVSKRSKFKF